MYLILFNHLYQLILQCAMISMMMMNVDQYSKYYCGAVFSDHPVVGVQLSCSLISARDTGKYYQSWETATVMTTDQWSERWQHSLLVHHDSSDTSPVATVTMSSGHLILQLQRNFMGFAWLMNCWRRVIGRCWDDLTKNCGHHCSSLLQCPPARVDHDHWDLGHINVSLCSGHCRLREL